ncbi:MAG: FAD:protein FMN transferase [Candidatus Omnitrophica bacterium]|nr:FAD:protein FMN transferase [Candidatus Omnitrophota bacterium]
MKKFILIITIVIIVLVAYLVLPKTYSQTRSMMGSYVRIDICSNWPAAKINQIYSEIWKGINERVQRFDKYSANSEISIINRSFPDPVKISDDLYELLNTSVQFSQLTQGGFDITVEPLIGIWKKAEEKNILPSADDISIAVAAIGSNALNLMGNDMVRLRNPIVKLDVGGIAKGYIVDWVVSDLHEHGLKNFLVDASGNMYASGINSSYKPWTIGIEDPHSNMAALAVIRLSDEAISTSGDEHRYYNINGKHYSHIINPHTGQPVLNMSSVTVLAPTAGAADALSTGLSVLGVADGLALIESLGPGYACFILTMNGTDRQTFFSSHYKDFNQKGERL